MKKMKKLILLLVLMLLVSGCFSSSKDDINVENLTVKHPSNYAELVNMFEEVEFRADTSSNEYLIKYQFVETEMVDGVETSKVTFEINGETTTVWIDGEGEAAKLQNDRETYEKDGSENLRYAFLEVKSKIPFLLSLPSERPLKRNFDKDYDKVEDVSFGGLEGKKYTFVTETEGLAGKTKTDLEIAIISEFMLVVREKVERENLASDFELISFKLR